jgi:hypothetical protein
MYLLLGIINLRQIYMSYILVLMSQKYEFLRKLVEKLVVQ